MHVDVFQYNLFIQFILLFCFKRSIVFVTGVVCTVAVALKIEKGVGGIESLKEGMPKTAPLMMKRRRLKTGHQTHWQRRSPMLVTP